MNDNEKESSEILTIQLQQEIQQWEYDHINLPGHADILIYGKSSPSPTFMIWGI